MDEWENSEYSDIYQDASAENVHLAAKVLSLCLDFWRHVGLCAAVGAQFAELSAGCKPKVRDFDVHLVVDEDIFKLEVPMAHCK